MNSLNIEGIGKVLGGTYDKVNVSGIGNISSDIEFNDMVVEGIIRINGSCKGDNIEVSGIAKCNDDIECNNISIDGLVSVKNIKTATITGNIEGFKANDIYADSTTLYVGKRNRINGIYGESVEIRETKRRFGMKTTVKEIIADNITLKGIVVDKVQGNNIRLEKCKVNEVICSGELTNIKSSIKNRK